MHTRRQKAIGARDARAGAARLAMVYWVPEHHSVFATKGADAFGPDDKFVMWFLTGTAQVKIWRNVFIVS
jgi:hypothetical protein